MDASRDLFIFLFLRTSSAGGGRGGAARLFLFFPVTTSGIGHRVKYLVVFSGLATNALNVRNNNNNYVAKSMYEEHLCVVALTSIERGTQFFLLASYFLV